MFTKIFTLAFTRYDIVLIFYYFTCVVIFNFLLILGFLVNEEYDFRLLGTNLDILMWDYF